MSADYGREKAVQVCVTCKARKKKCDKTMPRCGYCARKNLRCSFLLSGRDKYHGSYPSSLDLFSSRPFPEPAAADANLYRRVLQMIHETGQFIDDLTVRYFQGPHNYLPIVSRSRFQSNLITLGAVPSAGFSTLLLTICLTASSSKGESTADGDTPAFTKDRALYLATKSLLSRVQSSNPPCISLIQSRLLLALYDYTNRRPEEAFDAIAGCARMAYAARMHLNCRPMETHTDPDAQARAEAVNTWWGIVICERTFFCEVGFQEQPLITTIPNDAILPSGTGDQGQDGSPLSYLTTTAIYPGGNSSGFDRSVQAVWLLDKVIRSFEIPDLDSKLVQLQTLDNNIQGFLTELMRQCYSQEITSEYCQSIAITIRTLLKLHSHVIEQLGHVPVSQDPTLQSRYQKSQAALDTIAQMVLDIIEIHHTPPPDIIPPSFSYMTRAALAYVREQKDWQTDSKLHSAEERMRESLH
ncbi:hypothetical protein P170DRAFT_504829 [Aspergillus steynii IBT 23096]|uniref:Zn(2)-C6 fungal-type domain-containing protein n=1 Tax=Aspergillus steynii IBT 23096 TaxID=1392250 RepID=A0A2I2GM63_9EURO|nr:uncharacterized protein P170DRAFT_504829 [Aspergillus steynii IBT 23096]PLB53964.1 hypothetical protein P170DRAFT_504829 [Aspergillus steynii IBT 23096]